eukprot:6499786-Prorocentrum_lima.AAC.1
MYICTDPKDLEVNIRPGATSVHVLPLVQAPSGHLLLPCTEYRNYLVTMKQEHVHAEIPQAAL